MSTQALFQTGQIIATERAGRALVQANVGGLDLVHRHASGDWGDVGPEGREENERGLKDGGDLVSGYTLREGVRVWVLTEASRSKTTIMLPDEYPVEPE